MILLAPCHRFCAISSSTQSTTTSSNNPVSSTNTNFTTPSGAVIDSNGNIVSAPPISNQPANTIASTPASNTTQCNGGTYPLACPAGEHFFCPTNGTTAQCLPENAQYCNGAGYNACPAGDSFSCSSTGGVCSPPPTTYVAPQVNVYTPPPAPAGPTPAQQTATCQQQYNTALIALNSEGTQQDETSLNNDIAQDQQWIDQSGANGMAFSGMSNQAHLDLTQAQAELASTIAAYKSALEGIQNTLQTCLSSIPQS